MPIVVKERSANWPGFLSLFYHNENQICDFWEVGFFLENLKIISSKERELQDNSHCTIGTSGRRDYKANHGDVFSSKF